VVTVGSKVVRVRLWTKIGTPLVGAGATVEVVTEAAGKLVVEPPVVSTAPPSSSFHHTRLGNCTGVRNTMMHTTATRKPAAIAKSLRLCSMAPSKSDKNKPLRRKNKAMLTELLTRPGYQNPAQAETPHGHRR
jgi:hypothetical protein